MDQPFTCITPSYMMGMWESKVQFAISGTSAQRDVLEERFPCSVIGHMFAFV